MELNIRAGQRILYKDGNSGWMVGIIDCGNAEVNEQGLWIPIIPKNFMMLEREDVPYIQYAEVNNMFLEAQPVEDWMNKLTREEYIKFIQSEDFERALEQAWVSDGEYYYYPISKYNATWLNKQPFDYVIRSY